MRYLLLCIALLAPVAGGAAVYKLVKPDGSVVFSDQPLPGAKPVEVTPGNVYSAPKLPETPPADQAEGAAAASEDTRYRRVEVVSPSPETVLQNTTYTVDVDVLVEPPLRAGHRLVPVLDGTPLPPTGATHFQLQQVYRGAHTLQVDVHDAHGKSLAASAPVTFYVQQMSTLFPNNPLRPQVNPLR